jgi:hypothetical protein
LLSGTLTLLRHTFDSRSVLIRQSTWTESMSLDVSKDIDLDTVPEAEPEEPATPAPKEGEGIIEEP